MRPLLFVNWSAVNTLFRGLMWVVAIALVVVIVIHLLPATPPAHHPVRALR